MVTITSIKNKRSFSLIKDSEKDYRVCLYWKGLIFQIDPLRSFWDIIVRINLSYSREHYKKNRIKNVGESVKYSVYPSPQLRLKQWQ